MIKNIIKKFIFSVFLLCIITLASCTSTKKATSNAPAPDKKAESKTAIKPYKEVITDKASTDSGLFLVHKLEEKYLFEIPDSLFNRQMFMVTRIAKTATNLGYGGESLHEQVLRWQKRGKQVYLRRVSFNNVANDSLPIYQSVSNSNFEPIILAFDIKAYGKDSAVVIEVNDLFTKDVNAIGLDASSRTRYKVTGLDESRSYIESARSYPLNVEIRNVLTYKATEAPSNSNIGSISLELSNSMILLPEQPMMARIFDQRVGYFTVRQTDYGLDEQKATERTYISRWRLEPKDMEAYKRGELVEPKKQIVYYIDPATPEKWRPYLKQGVEDWQKAFEAAGFKNAIIAKDAPTKEEDPDWSPEDARYSVIRYFASDVQNAYGPSVKDPRSGEILESDIGWYHNVMNLLRNWFFIQTSAINPDARKTKFDDEVMGRLIRFVSAHEVGHTIGLPHNMGSSAAYPVDSLRSATFTKKMGTAPSIMDYARFNYIAQPEDKGVALMPEIGIYDKYAVEWGYRVIPEASSTEDEKETLSKWILAHEGDPLYKFGRQTANPIDPRAQTEDLGDNAMKAGMYGIANLKRTLPKLIEWTAEDMKNYDDLDEMYKQLIGQWNRYLGHARSNIGGVYENYKTYEQEGVVYEPVPKAIQKDAMNFLNEQAFKTPNWLIEKEVLNRIEAAGAVERLRNTQENMLNGILDPGRLARIIEAETMSGSSAYTILELFGDLRSGIWSELRSSAATDTYRRNLQRAYIQRLEYLMTKDQASVPAGAQSFLGFTQVNVAQSDIRPVVRAELKILQRQIQNSVGGVRDALTRYHLQDALSRIDVILNPKS